MPSLRAMALAQLKLSVAFHRSGVVEALPTDTPVSAVFKPVGGHAGEAFSIDDTAVKSGTGTATRYALALGIDSDPMRALLGDQEEVEVRLQITWGEYETDTFGEAEPLAVIVVNSYARPDGDAAPDPTSDAGWNRLKAAFPVGDSVSHDEEAREIIISPGGSPAWDDVTGKPTFGTAALVDTGTTANKVVKLDGTGKLPAVDGSQLTNLPAGGVSDHGALTGLSDDDHTQYHTDARGDARYDAIGAATAAQAAAVQRANHTGTQTADTITDGTTNKVYSATEQTKLAGIEAAADVTDAANVGAALHGATAKTTPVDADTLPLVDSEASNVLKKLTFLNLWLYIKAKADALYSTFSGAYADLTGKPTLGTMSSQAASAVAITGGTASGVSSLGLVAFANTTPLTITGHSNTGTSVAPMIDLAGTWNTSGTTPAAISLDMTHTAATAPRWWQLKRSGTNSLWAGLVTLFGNTNAPYFGGGANGTNAMVMLNNNAVTLARADAGWGLASSYNFSTVPSDAKFGFYGYASSQNSPPSGSLMDAYWTRRGAANIVQGELHATTATPQIYQAHDVTTGTGAPLILSGGRGSTAGGATSLATSATNGTPRAVVTARADGELELPVATVESASDPASTHKITIYIGGTRYKLLAIQE